MIFNARESLTNAIIGLLVSWCEAYFILPAWGLFPDQAFTQTGGLSK